ncbi:hypothetical protein [Marisediminicola sp. LYQ134]|uniref:hypothetical protein n=1 Tax=unclassified Marisediminicola TaxID=2618316 RepID=UPI003983C3FE
MSDTSSSDLNNPVHDTAASDDDSRAYGAVDDETTTSPASERDIQAKQNDQSTTATDDAEVDEDQIEVLPGTGGPDDVGDIEVDPSELNLSGDSIPGHPKPGSPEDV